MGLHIAVCHIVACDATEGLATLRTHAKEHDLTVVIFYRVAAAADTWEDVILVCEGEQPRLDAFIEMLRGSEPLLRCASTLMRQWSYTAQELHLPSERVGWGYHEWCDFAAQELQAHEQQQQQQRPPPTPPPPAADDERLLGPAGFRGAKYTDYGELTLTRLERLGLGCSWSDAMSRPRPVWPGCQQ